jgi:hypothetical protein
MPYSQSVGYTWHYYIHINAYLLLMLDRIGMIYDQPELYAFAFGR